MMWMADAPENRVRIIELCAKTAGRGAGRRRLRRLPATRSALTGTRIRELPFKNFD
jgi:hypothetical protein